MKFWLKLFDTLNQDFREAFFPKQKNKQNFLTAKSKLFSHKIFINWLLSFRVGTKHIQVENQFLFKLCNLSGVSSGYNFHVASTIWSLSHSEASSFNLGPSKHSTYSLNQCWSSSYSEILSQFLNEFLGESSRNFDQFHFCLKCIFLNSSLKKKWRISASIFFHVKLLKI